MIRPEAAVALLAVAVAVVVGPGAKALPTMRVRLNDWYDRREGLGGAGPCGTQDLREYSGPEGILLDIPACWRTRSQHRGDLGVHYFDDDTLGDAGHLILRATPRHLALHWARAVTDLEARLRRPGARIDVAGDFHIVRTLYTKRSDRVPTQWIEWIGEADDRAFQLVYRLPRPMLTSPRVRRQIAIIERAIASVRLTGPDDCAP